MSTDKKIVNVFVRWDSRGIVGKEEGGNQLQTRWNRIMSLRILNMI